jgi:hypothetical protein
MKIDKKRLLWALREELYIVLAVVVIVILLAIPWVLMFLTDSRWWILLYPAAFFVIGVWEKYNGR